MPAERSQRIEELYHAARQRDPDQRVAFLQQACAGDEDLQREVESLLAEDDGVESFLETPALEFIRNMSGEDSSQSMIGRQLGSFHILSLLGKGGMGEVYCARDSKLGRDVAFKILPETFAGNPERLARFRREARLLASLNHPNIAAIYGMEESEGLHCLVMELVPGETLAGAGPLPLDKALIICRQLAEGLEEAHRKNITHRDIKPANIKLTPKGVVKILDFGLAKAWEQSGLDLSEQPVPSSVATQEGQILGTPAYMSPEQVRGKTVDKQTDIWAFGCVLYELLTGKHAFQGDTLSDTISKVLAQEADWRFLPATPEKVRDLLRRCLQKDAKRRLQDIGDARIEIEDALISPAPAEPVIAVVPQSRPNRRRALLWGASALVLLTVASLAVWNLKPTPPKPVARTVVALPPDDRLVVGPLPAVALSPDGAQLAYVASQGGKQQIYLRAIDSLEARPVSGTEGAFDPFFSPDGQWLGFILGGRVKKVPVGGGAPVEVSRGVAASWGNNNMIVLLPNPISNLWQVPAAGGTPQPLTRLERGELRHLWPEVLPGGKAVVFTVVTSPNPDDAQIVVQSLENSERRVLVNGGSNPRYATSGHLIYIRRGTLLALPFDLKRLEATGPPVTVLEGVMETAGGAGYFNVASNGSLVYVPGTGGGNDTTLVWVDRKGAAEPLKAPSRPYRVPRLSPDGQQLAVVVEDGKNDIWIHSLTRDTLTRLTFEGTRGSISWTRDGRRVVFIPRADGPQNLISKPADGSGGELRLAKGISAAFTLDGRSYLYVDVDAKTGTDIRVMPLVGDRTPWVFLRTPYNETTPRLSPDDRFVAYVSDESGRNEVYIQPFPGPGGKYQISNEGGTEIVWAANGELFYRNGDKMMAVEIKTQPSLSVGRLRQLFEGYAVSTGIRVGPVNTAANYDVTADGQRFLMIQSSTQSAAATQIIVVQNWFEELNRKVAISK